MIPVDFCQNNDHVINFTTDEIISKFEEFSKKNDALYLTEIMQTEWLQMLDEYWDEGDTPYLGDFISWRRGCFNITINCL